MSNIAGEYLEVLRPGEFNPLAEVTEAGVAAGEAPATSAATPKQIKPKKPLVKFYSPSQLLAYQTPPNQNMVGDYHLQHGGMSVLAGPPGVGKSLATLGLALAGAKGRGVWFGGEVHCQFRTLILQNENGLPRLNRDIRQLGEIQWLDDWISISAPPAYGLALQNPAFRAEMGAMMATFRPDLLIIDPWNACVRDAMERDFLEGIALVREITAESPGNPATLIVHHLRKPKSEDRHKGRSLAHLLSGSYVLASMARSVWVMQSASDNTEDSRVAVTCSKNNDGQLGPRTAWERRSGAFAPVDDFDWDAFDNSGGVKHEAKINPENLIQLFDNGRRWMTQKQAAERLQEVLRVGRSAAYEALKISGRFSNLLIKNEDGLIGLRQVGIEAQQEAE